MEIFQVNLSEHLNEQKAIILLETIELQYRRNGPVNLLVNIEAPIRYESFYSYLSTIKLRPYFYALIRRLAIVSPSQEWLQTLSSTIDLLTPGIGLSCFNEHERAKYWLLSGATENRKNVILKFTTDKRTSAFQVNGELAPEDCEFINSIIIEDQKYNIGEVNLHFDLTNLSFRVISSVISELKNLKYYHLISNLKLTSRLVEDELAYKPLNERISRQS